MISKEKGLKELNKLKVQCKCGHKTVIPVFKDYVICSYCGEKVLNNTRLYFIYKLRRELNGEEDRGKRR